MTAQTSTTARKRPSRASRAADAAKTDPKPASVQELPGKPAVGDRRPAAKPKPVADAKPASPAKPQKPKLTPSQDRLNRGTSDAEIVAGVREYAKAHVNDGGWDAINEAWTDEQIVEAVGWAETVKGAVKKLAPIVSTYAEREADAAISAGETSAA